MKKQNNSLKAIIILVFVIVALLLTVLIGLVSSRMPSNPPGTVGNTAGNLNNSGLFCEKDGVVYFSNSFDGGSLYSMTPSEGELRKLSEVTACNILTGGKYLYYFRYGTATGEGLGSVRTVKSFNRCKLNGDDTTSLTRDVVVKAQLVGDYLYMLVAGDTPEFYKMKTDKSEKSLLADYEINPACAENGTIYYNGTQYEHYLYGLETANDTSYVIWKGNLWYPVKQGDYIYYLDVAENYRLCRYSLTDNVIEVLTNERVDCYNVNGNYLYYQTNSSTPALKFMYTDGSGVQTVAEGVYTNINITSQFVYFQEFSSDITTYHSYLGSTTYEEFAAAKAAAFTK